MNRNRHPNLDLCDTIIRLPDGTLTVADIEYQTKIPWGEPPAPLNARPDRIKMCVLCLRHLPIAQFVIQDGPLRTLLRGEFAYVLADIRTWCDLCDLILIGVKQEMREVNVALAKEHHA